MTPDRKANPEKMGARNARTTTRLAVSAPAGLAVLLIIGTVAFGHEGLFPRQPDPDADTGARVEATATPKAEEIAQATPKPAATPKADEVARVEATPKPVQAEPTPKPVQAQPERTPKPVPAPQPPTEPTEPTAALTLSVAPSDYPGKLMLSWSAYGGDGFHYYKLVRSHDATATWPASGDDEMIAAIGNPAETAFRDRPECGVTVFYRVFAVRSTDAGYQVLAPSNTVSAVTECPAPPPATVGIGFDAVFADGQVHLAWGACEVEGFNAWKIVRSQTNAEPMYPENDGTVLIAVIGDPNQTSFVDTSVESGQTWFYRVLARADQGGGNFIACQTQAAAVTIP
ncbi:MAG: hypothetical protein ABI841_08065 [Chloroflexota bacterium]